MKSNNALMPSQCLVQEIHASLVYKKKYQEHGENKSEIFRWKQIPHLSCDFGSLG